MNFDDYLDSVSRSVSYSVREDQPIGAVRLDRTYATTKKDLWDAITDPDRLSRWFLPVSGDLRLGGRYRLEGNAEGTITECNPPQFLAATWEFQGQMSWIEVRISGVSEASSKLTLIHICPVDEHWKTYGPGAAGVGWEFGLVGLDAHLVGQTIDDESFAGAEGQEYVAKSARAWGEAAADAGDDRDAAAAAAERTAAFYTGTEQAES